MPALFELIFIVGVCFLVGSAFVNSVKSNQQQERLENAFYQILEAENGTISLIQLAVAARVNAESAKQFLSTQVKLFNAELEVDTDGDTFYRFPKLRRSLHG